MASWFDDKHFPDPPSPLADFWVTVHVELHEPLQRERAERAFGYFRILGLRCDPNRLERFIEHLTTDGNVIFGTRSHWHEVSLNELNRELRATLDPKSDECVWHDSGRVYFGELRRTEPPPPTASEARAG